MLPWGRGISYVSHHRALTENGEDGRRKVIRTLRAWRPARAARLVSCLFRAADCGPGHSRSLCGIDWLEEAPGAKMAYLYRPHHMTSAGQLDAGHVRSSSFHLHIFLELWFRLWFLFGSFPEKLVRSLRLPDTTTECPSTGIKPWLYSVTGWSTENAVARDLAA